MRNAAMPNYTKLFSSIVTSTIWTEDDKTRILWITMLAISDQHGEVHASIPGLARIAGLSVEDCEMALGKFLSPDEYSRTKDFEGKRIAEIPGGWELLNHAKYRRIASKIDKDESNAARQARHREREKERNASVTHSNASVTHEMDKQKQKQDTNTEAEASTPKAPNRRKRVTRVALECEAFKEFWSAYPRKEAPANAEKAWVNNGCAALLPKILVAIRAAKITDQWTRESGRWIPHPATWLNRRSWEDELLPRSSGGITENIKIKRHYINGQLQTE